MSSGFLRFLGYSAVLLAGLSVAASVGQARVITVSKPTITIKKQKNFPLKVVGRQDFCSRFSNSFEILAKRTGLNTKDSTIFGFNATTSIVSEFRNGRATDFINSRALSAMAGKPDFSLKTSNKDGFVPLSDFVAGAMGIKRPVHLVLSPTELRYIPFSQQQMELVVIAENAASITPERARRVARVAQTQRMRIHVVWVGQQSANKRDSEAMSLAYLSAVTGGTFVDLSGEENPCTSLL